jgi:hypothetical protein
VQGDPACATAPRRVGEYCRKAGDPQETAIASKPLEIDRPFEYTIRDSLTLKIDKDDRSHGCSDRRLGGKTMTSSISPAPELIVQTWYNTDRPLLLSGLRGRVVVLAAFQVLCPKSLSSGIPQAERIYDTFEPSDVAVIGLHATFEHHDAVSPAVVKAFIQEYRLKFPIALDQLSAGSPIPHTMERYKMRGTPSLVLIDKQGLVRKHTFGPVDDLRIGAEIGALTQEGASSIALSRSSAA